MTAVISATGLWTPKDSVSNEELVEGFNAYVGESDDPAIRFEHSGNFALVDRDGYIRSRKDAYGNWTYVYSGIEENESPAQLEEIMEDAETLLNK